MWMLFALSLECNEAGSKMPRCSATLEVMPLGNSSARAYPIEVESTVIEDEASQSCMLHAEAFLWNAEQVAAQI